MQQKNEGNKALRDFILDYRKDTRLIPEKWCIFSGSMLKLFAVLVMLIDHTAAFVLPLYKPAVRTIFSIGSHEISLCKIMNYIGRLAFPIFVFLLVEGFCHTKNRKKYAKNLFIFALISEIPWNLIHSGTLIFPKQNVFFTLLLGCLGMWAIEAYQENKLRQLLSLLGLLTASVILKADYGIVGFGYVLLIYILREQKILQTILGACFLPSRWIAGLAFISINLYNGRRGFVQGSIVKYAFYAFYPLHFICLYFIRLKLFGI